MHRQYVTASLPKGLFDGEWYRRSFDGILNKGPGNLRELSPPCTRECLLGLLQQHCWYPELCNLVWVSQTLQMPPEAQIGTSRSPFSTEGPLLADCEARGQVCVSPSILPTLLEQPWRPSALGVPPYPQPFPLHILEYAIQDMARGTNVFCKNNSLNAV